VDDNCEINTFYQGEEGCHETSYDQLLFVLYFLLALIELPIGVFFLMKSSKYSAVSSMILLGWTMMFVVVQSFKFAGWLDRKKALHDILDTVNTPFFLGGILACYLIKSLLFSDYGYKWAKKSSGYIISMISTSMLVSIFLCVFDSGNVKFGGIIVGGVVGLCLYFLTLWYIESLAVDYKTLKIENE
jgi:hypothetical protein